MSLGSGGNIFAGGPQQQSSAGPAGAFNGTSVNAITNKVQLGQIGGDPDNPAMLVDLMEIPINGYGVQFLSDYVTDSIRQRVSIEDTGIYLSGKYGFPQNRNAQLIFQQADGLNRETHMYQNQDRLLLEMTESAVVNSAMEFLYTGQVVYRGITLQNSAPEADFTISGSCAFRTVFQSTSVSVGVLGQGNFSILSQGGSGIIIDISGSSPVGCRFTATLYDSAQVDISGINEIIRAGVLSTAAGAPISSNTAGSSITLECVESGVTNPVWIATSLTGTWFV